MLFHRIISYVFFPGTMAILGFVSIVIRFLNSKVPFSEQTPTLFWLVILLGYVVFPLVVLSIFIRLGVLKDIHLYDRKKRNISYPVAIAGAVGVYFSLTEMTWSSTGSIAIYAQTWSLCILGVLSVIWLINFLGLKASAHAAGCAGFLALNAVINNHVAEGFIIGSACIFGLVYASRRALSAHSHIELVTGSLAGFLVTFALIIQYLL
jgi:hypothetical protein